MIGDKETRFLGAAVAACACVIAVPPASGQPQAEQFPLQEGQTQAFLHGAADVFVYRVDALAAQAYLIELEQRGLDLVVGIEAPDGSTLTFNSPLWRDEPETILLEGTTVGSYLVSVYSEEHTGAVGGHAIRLRNVSSASAVEIEAWRLMGRGAAANVEGGDEGWTAAAAAYEAAAEHWQALGRPLERARALFALATLEYWQRYDWRRAAEVAAEVADHYETLGEARLRANALHLQGAALVERALEMTQSSESPDAPTGDTLFEQALVLLEQARAIHEPLGNVYDLGLVINNFGYLHYSRGTFDQARRYWEEASALMRSLDEWSAELNALTNLAVLDAESGDVAGAIQTFERVLSILPEDSQQRYRADTLDNLGISHLMFGNAEQALQSFSSALAIQSEIDDIQGGGRSLRGIGRTYYALGELELAETYLRRALPVAQQTNDGRNQEGIFRDLGNIAYLVGDYESALALHREALDIVNSASDRAYLELLIAKDLIALGRYDEAEALAAPARTAAERSGSALLLAEALHQTGRAQLQGADPDRAVAQLERAADIYESLNLQAQHAEALQSLAAAASSRGRPLQAVEYGEASLDQLERVRLRVASPELRAFFASARREYYENQIARLMALHGIAGDEATQARAALHTSERARARMITDLLQEASIDLVRGVDTELERQQSALYARLAERGRERDDMLADAPEGPDPDRLTAVLADIASTENELNLLEIELRRSPTLAKLSPPEPLTLPDMQALLDPDSVLLQYALTDQGSYVWVVTRSSFTTVELADRKAIEATARRVVDRLHGYVPARASGAALAEDLRALADLLLAPVAPHLDKRRIVLSLDGVLQYLPFAALPVQSADGGVVPLLHAHEIVHVPSMSALAALILRRADERATKTLAVFADPVLDAADPRLDSGAPVVARASLGELPARGAAGPELRRLPSTAYEADAISALVSADQRLVARGFDASRNAVLQTELDDYRYIHFATHGLVDTHYPALSALAMSQFDERGTPQNGFLRLHDIYRLDLSADLVVLSACETALGREVRGEGLLGLSQGFMYAGARSLIASLWQVSDRATAELMTKFYRFMLNDGMPPAQALREAQLASAAERRWSDPYFWSGFVLLGDWR